MATQTLASDGRQCHVQDLRGAFSMGACCRDERCRLNDWEAIAIKELLPERGMTELRVIGFDDALFAATSLNNQSATR